MALFGLVFHPPWEKRRYVQCGGGPKQIDLALLMYTGDASGFFPNLDATGMVNVEPLNSLDLLASGKVYSIPPSSIARPTAAAGKHPTNEWMNALFIDGHSAGGRP